MYKSKHIQYYDKERKEWRDIASPNIDVNAVLEDGDSIKDTNVKVTNPRYYTENEENPDLSEVLDTINDEMDTMQRNIAWLAEHGGNGGSGGGGSTTSFGIQLITPTLTNNAAYITDDSITISFMITGGSENDICTYSYTYDNGKTIESGVKSEYVNKTITVTFDNATASKSEYWFNVNATNPYGGIIAPLSFNIYKSKFKVTNKPISNVYENYIQGIYNVSSTYKSAFIPLSVECGLLGATMTFSTSWSQKTTTTTFTNSTTSEQELHLPLWGMIEDAPSIGSTYVIKISSQANLNALNISANDIYVTIKVINPNDLSILITINGGIESATEDTIVPLDDTMVYSMNFSGPSSLSTIYYAAKIKRNNDDEILICGKYYDETLKEEGATYSDNNSIAINNSIIQNYTISSGYYEIDDKIVLSVKAWNYNNRYSAEETYTFHIGESLNEIFPRQYETNTLFASFNKSYNVGADTKKWVSNINDYNFISPGYEGSNVKLDLIVNKSNGVNSGLLPDDNGVLRLRLQNQAYATIDTSIYENEINDIINNYYGFTLSLTYRSDYTSSKKNIFLWGENYAEGDELYSGIKISSDMVQWCVFDKEGIRHPLNANVSLESKSTIDFTYDATSKIVSIYVNGEPNYAVDLSAEGGLHTIKNNLPTSILFGCDSKNGELLSYSDMDVYEFSIYSHKLNDLQINVNSKNAKLNGLSSSEEVKSDYNIWKKKNYIYSTEEEKTVPLSYLFDNGNYRTSYSEGDISTIANNSEIPILTINLTNESFTEDYFYGTGVNTSTWFTAVAKLYNPKDGTTTTITFNVEIAVQGTSTINYKVKNIEIRLTDTFEDPESQELKPYLLQIKENWFPENEYTLKADVVDSAHINNTVIGEWINNSPIFEKNPVMQQFTVDGDNPTAPLDVDKNGNVITSLGGTTTHKNLTIKHTLEGFPVLLFIRFGNGDGFKLIGIYSFNLGRAAYYNMGMKFLDRYCKRNNEGSLLSCPCIIEYYKEKASLGNINASDIYSYEFGENSSESSRPLWTQFSRSVINAVGEFKYPDQIPDNVWNNLLNLFEQVAKSKTGKYYEDQKTYTGYDNIYNYTYDPDTKSWIQGADKISQTDTYYTSIPNIININNFNGYFVTANAFGLTDSLGKNMTLRTWDGGKTWWPVFYDMDTALGLRNTGAQDIASSCYIDSFVTKSDSNTRTTSTYTNFHESNDYAAFNAKIWGLLRDRDFMYANNWNGIYNYEKIWANLRNSQGLLSSSSKFVKIIEDRINECGELLYCADYNNKYIEKGVSGLDASIGFLHGNRLEYIRDWLKKHFYFLDGALNAPKYVEESYTYTDSPLYSDKFFWAFWYENSNVVPLTVQVSTPCFLLFNTNTTNDIIYYISESNKDVTIYYPNSTGNNTQTYIMGASLLTKLDGMANSGFKNISPSGAGVLSGLEKFDISNNKKLIKNNPLSDLSFLHSGNYSSLNEIDLSSTKTSEDDPSALNYKVSLIPFNKLLKINISGSEVNSLTLPNSTLQELKLSNSKISELKIVNQPSITGFSVSGCDKLVNVEINNCGGYTDLPFNSLIELTSIKITNCEKVENITIKNCDHLQNVYIDNNLSLKNIVIEDCDNPNLEIVIQKCPLESITLKELETTKSIVLPSFDYLANLSSFKLDSIFSFKDIVFGTETVKYKDEFMLDLSHFNNLRDNFVLRFIPNVKYIRFTNDELNPIEINERNIYRCENLCRVIGHIKLTDNKSFKDNTNFYINEPNNTIGFNDSLLTTFNPSDEWTNVTIGTDDLSNCFSHTSCSLIDVYYIFQKCENVAIIDSMFTSCDKIITDETYPLSDDIFSKCGNVIQMNNLFSGDSGIYGRFDSSKLLTPLTKITEFNNVFDGCNIFIGDNTSFFPQENNITSISGFNPDGDNIINASTLLKNLTKLKKIADSFSDCRIDFGEDVNGTKLFAETVALEEISDSFVNVVGAGSLYNIFGGYYDGDDNKLYSKYISKVNNSFVFLSESYHTPGLLGDDDTGSGILMPYGNKLLSKIKDSIKDISITESTIKEDRVDFYSFRGDGIYKYVLLNDCDNEGFPYKIFKDCKALEKIPSFFSNMNISSIEDVIQLPISENGTSLFEDCISLVNVSYLFNKMQNITYKLVGNGFKNCNITDFSNIFSEKDNIDCKKIGQIPFHLFYQEETLDYTEQTGLTIAQAEAYGISGSESGTIPNLDNITVFNGKYKKAKTIIENMSNALSETKNEGISQYVCSNKFDMLIEDNEDYNPLKYILNGKNYTLNTKYNPYPKKWNKFAYDNSYEFNTSKFNFSELEVTYGNVVDFSKMPECFSNTKETALSLIGRLNSAHTGYDKEKYYDIYTNIFAKENYFCAPDIFRYCANISPLNIKGVFKNCGSRENSFGSNGIKGKIPEMLFEPINNCINIDELFTNCPLILPETWGTVIYDTEELKDIITMGTSFAKDLLLPLANLRSVKQLFEGCTIWGYTAVPKNLFSSCKDSLAYVSGLFKNAAWKDIRDDATEHQLPMSLFSGCYSLLDVGSMFYTTSRTNSLRYMNSGFLTAMLNPSISSCSYFMNGCSLAKGSLPPFWDWITSKDFDGAYYGLTPEYIDGYDDMKNAHPRYFS